MKTNKKTVARNVAQKKKLVKENDDIRREILKIKFDGECQITRFFLTLPDDQRPDRLKGIKEMHVYENLQDMHFVPRENWNFRWDTRNGTLGSQGLHYFYVDGSGWNLETKRRFWIWILGEDIYKDLSERSKVMRLGKKDLSTALLWNTVLRSEFLKIAGTTYEEFLKERKKEK